jgi:phosphoenolpyruvate phosphomutase / 2-hydroxyethylphosphonate cytidylyltransferase
MPPRPGQPVSTPLIHFPPAFPILLSPFIAMGLEGAEATRALNTTLFAASAMVGVLLLVRFRLLIILLNDVLDVTTKPIIYDGDTGGKPEHFVFTVKTLERMGISAVIVEDKVGLKKNSLFGTDVPQTQASVEDFSHKLTLGKQAQITDEFMIIARIESLILNQGVDDAMRRAEAYIAAGADGIMIHSKAPDPDEILAFCERFRTLEQRVPLVAVPSTYSSITERELIDAGVNIVIYANHLLRSAYPAMVATAEGILRHGRAKEVNRGPGALLEHR